MTAVLVGIVAFAAGVAIGVALLRRPTATGTGTAHPAPLDDADFRQAIQRLGAAFAARDRDAIVEVILDTAVLAVGADSAVLYAASTPTSSLEVRATHGVDAAGLGLAPGEGVAGRAAADDHPVAWPGGPPGVHRADGEPAAATALAVPLHSSERLLGVVAVYAADPDRRFSPAELVTLATVVRQAETAIDNVLLHEEAERLSITDGLTGVWNRRHLDLRSSEELRRARRFGEPFSLVLVDVDDFKRVNDTHGHQTGDAVLVELAGRLASSVREVDTVARYGGEEFCLLLPRTDVGGAELLAEKVRDAVASAAFPTDGGELHVTVSVGVATHPVHGGTVPQLMSAVDAALYRAKRAGKNRVEVAVGALEGRPG